MRDETGQSREARNFCSREHVCGGGVVEEGKITLVGHCRMLDWGLRRVPGTSAADGEEGRQEQAATRDQRGCCTRRRLGEGQSEVVVESSSRRRWTVGTKRERAEPGEGGLGIMKEAAVEAPDG